MFAIAGQSAGLSWLAFFKGLSGSLTKAENKS